jgi:hypothetical protein
MPSPDGSEAMSERLGKVARCARAAAVLVAVALAGCDGRPSVPPVSHEARAQALHAAPDPAAAVGRYAVNVLVLPLLDDAEPPRFSTFALPLICADEADVGIDGRPLVDGAEVPAGSFVVHWRFVGTCPFGIDGTQLAGAVDVLVLRDDAAGLQAVVLPRSATQIARGTP